MRLPRGIRQRGSKFFVDVTLNGQRKTATCGSLSAAVEAQAKIREALATGKGINNTRSNAVAWTLQQALDKTLEFPKPDGWRGMSYEKQATLNAQDAINFFGPNTVVSSLSLDRIHAWLHDCEIRGNSNSTINRKRSALSKIARVAYEHGGMAEPLHLPRQRKEPVGRIRQISLAEEAALLHHFNVMGQTDMADYVTTLLDTGLRKSELLNVRPADVHLKEGVLMVYGTEGKGTKNGKIRSVPMTKRVSALMRLRMEGSTCFALSEGNIRAAWDRARAHLGLTDDKNFTLHVCRHTCASRLIRGGVSLPVVKDWLGHSTIQTTMRYAHLYPQDLMNATKALERDDT